MLLSRHGFSQSALPTPTYIALVSVLLWDKVVRLRPTLTNEYASDARRRHFTLFFKNAHYPLFIWAILGVRASQVGQAIKFIDRSFCDLLTLVNLASLTAGLIIDFDL
mmetsp:Transcript_16380/g.22154  ORF Transcript_16380/g.22154 Transcript_16380/m.22154 type:complete len:108 (+) Transcript_16380:2058-2381(+)